MMPNEYIFIWVRFFSPLPFVFTLVLVMVVSGNVVLYNPVKIATEIVY